MFSRPNRVPAETQTRKEIRNRDKQLPIGLDWHLNDGTKCASGKARTWYSHVFVWFWFAALRILVHE